MREEAIETGMLSATARDARAHADSVRQLKRKGAMFVKALAVEVERAARYQRPLALLILRLERAARVHTTVWDAQRRVVMEELHERALSALRTPDFFAQVGAAEFAVCLPETDAPGAGVAAGKLLATERMAAVLARTGKGVTGVTPRAFCWSAADANGEAFLARALGAMAAS